MATIYLDSSAYIKEFTKEKGTETVEKIFDACMKGRHTLVTSLWTLSECIAVIDRKHRRQEMTSDEMSLAVTTLIAKTYDLSGKGALLVVSPMREVVTASWSTITARHVSADDALHLISATVGLCDMFVAADEYLVRAARDEGFASFNIEEDKESKELAKRLRL